METSIFLARVIGLFSLISATAIVTRYKKNLALEKDVVANPGLSAFAGFIILLLGILLIVSHQVWTFDWRVVITIIGWLTFFKGIGRIFFPEMVKKMIEKKQSDYRFIFAEMVMIGVGLYLLYYGFIVY